MQNKIDGAVRIIRELLHAGPLEAAEMLYHAYRQNIGVTTFNSAKRLIGVLSYRRGDKWYWEIKDQPAASIQSHIKINRRAREWALKNPDKARAIKDELHG